jgi:hypothetical protein
MFKMGCSNAEINENKMYKNTFLLGHPLYVLNHKCKYNCKHLLTFHKMSRFTRRPR